MGLHCGSLARLVRPCVTILPHYLVYPRMTLFVNATCAPSPVMPGSIRINIYDSRAYASGKRKTWSKFRVYISMRIFVFSGFTGTTNRVIKIATKRKQGRNEMNRPGFIRDALAVIMLSATYFLLTVILLAI